ncbi:flagellar basal body-associated FliL family protein [Natronincola ferrireducens]|uniref:Flagellar protein FliL n=1 Tax=Natronincola ferrireducens TaxID=393762 RepID=A0A1G9C1W7_9FIRM|nr:flagellar basal body-associated FliL family protein [Natronincola ferrireducens]SDK45638.1 flagellar FliL protein [Natronincola ferrireducens]
MNFRKILLYSLIGFVLSGIFFGTILYFTVFRVPKEVSNYVETYKFHLGSFSTNLSHQRSFFKGEITVETTDKSLLKNLDEKNAELRDQIIKTIIGQKPEDILNPEGQQELRQELIRIISEVMASDKITNVYFTDYIIQ